MIWRKLDGQMRLREVPLRRDLRLRIAETIPKALVYREVRRMITGARLPGEVLEWALGSLEITHVPPKKFFDLRNGGAVMRKASMEEIQAFMRENEKEVRDGVGFQRVGGSAKIQIQTSLDSRVKDIRSACAPLSMKFQAFLDSRMGGLSPSRSRWSGGFRKSKRLSRFVSGGASTDPNDGEKRSGSEG